MVLVSGVCEGLVSAREVGYMAVAAILDNAVTQFVGVCKDR